MFLLCVIGALIALQFVTGISQFLIVNKDAARATAGLKWLMGKIGLAPALITTRAIIIGFFVLVYFFLPKFLLMALIAGVVYYLYKTGSYIALWSEIKDKATQAETAVSGDVASVVKSDVSNVVSDVVQDVEKKI